MQKTVYEMRISDGSSDVCSSDLWEWDRARRAWWRGSDVASLAPPSVLRTATSPSLRDREEFRAYPKADALWGAIDDPQKKRGGPKPAPPITCHQGPC